MRNTTKKGCFKELVGTYPVKIHADGHENKEHTNNNGKAIAQTLEHAHIFFVVHAHGAPGAMKTVQQVKA